MTESSVMDKPLHWPNRAWCKSANFHEDGSPLWVSHEPTALDESDRRFVEQNWPPSDEQIIERIRGRK